MKASIFITLMTIFLSANICNAQVDRMKEQLEDETIAMDEGKLTLRFINALNGDAVKGADIKIKGIGEFESDARGRVLFPTPEKDGIYDVYFEKEGYIPCDLNFEVLLGSIFYNRFSVSPKIDVGTIRIVLDWDNKPDDLDAHFVKEGDYHISFHDMKATDDDMVILDRDDRDGWGPETITVKDLDDKAEYKYYVKDYTNRDKDNSKALSKSKATVKVYGEEGLLAQYKLEEKQKGNTWMVFRIRNGKIERWDEVNRYY